MLTSSVKGESANALFKALAVDTGEMPSWNFNKYVIGKDGKAIKHYGSGTKPLGDDLEQTVQKALML